MYKISIIIPIYNMEKTLKNTLNSIINQTMDFNNIEVIMVNDCSTDNSKQIMDEYSQKYDNFKSINLNENNGSPAIARNIGIENASAEYIQFLDADDTLVETACDFLYDMIIEENVDLVSGYLYEIDYNNKVKINVYEWEKNIFNDNQFTYNQMKEILESDELYKFQFDSIWESPRWLLDYGFYNKIYKKSLILENDIYFPNLEGGEDTVFLFNYMINAKGIIFANRPVTLHDNYIKKSLSKSKSLKTISDRPKAYKLMYDLAVEKDVKEEFINSLLSAKLGYWLRVHVFNAFNLLNDEIINLLKEYKILFDECINYNVDFENMYYEIAKNIMENDFMEAIRKINLRRIENSNYSNTFIISLSDENQVNEILDFDFNFEKSELIFINNNLNLESINEIQDEYTVKFIPKSSDSKRIAIENSLGDNITFINSKNQLNESIDKMSHIIKNNNLDYAFAYDSYDKINKEDLNEEDCSLIMYKREFVQNELKDCESDLFENALQKSYNFRAIDINSLDEIYSNQENCKISVIMPVYNAERYLEESIECILNQSFKDIELICVDDESQDSSVEILQKIANEDKRMHFYCQNHKGGGAARNFALKKATGKYLYFMDADDLIKPNALEELYDKIEESQVDFVICKSIVYDSDNDVYVNRPYFYMEPIYNIVGDDVFHYKDVGSRLFKFSVTPWAKLFNREFVLKTGAQFGEGLIFHDHFFFWEVLFNSEKILFYNKELCIYRTHSKSSTESKDYRYINFFNVYKGIFEIFMKYNEFYNHEQIIYNNKIYSAINRYILIQNKYQPAFFDKMKEDFTEMLNDEKYKNIENLLYDSNLIFFKCVLESENNVDFNIHLMDQLGENINKLNNANEKLGNDLKSKDKEIKKLKKSNKKLKKKNKKLKNNYNEIISSSSWKITSPLRKIRNFRK